MLILDDIRERKFAGMKILWKQNLAELARRKLGRYKEVLVLSGMLFGGFAKIKFGR